MLQSVPTVSQTLTRIRFLPLQSVVPNIHRLSSLAFQNQRDAQREISHIPVPASTFQAFHTLSPKTTSVFQTEAVQKAFQYTSEQSALLTRSLTSEAVKSSLELDIAQHALVPMRRMADDINQTMQDMHLLINISPKPLIYLSSSHQKPFAAGLLLAFERHMQHLQVTLRSSEFAPLLKGNIKTLDSTPETAVARNNGIPSAIKINDELLEKAIFQFLKTLAKTQGLSLKKLITQVSLLSKVQKENLKESYAQALVLYLTKPHHRTRDSNQTRLNFRNSAMIGGAPFVFIDEEQKPLYEQAPALERLEAEGCDVHFLSPSLLIRSEEIVIPTFVTGGAWTLQPIADLLEAMLSAISHRINGALATGSASISSVVNKMVEAINICTTIMHSVTQFATQLPERIKGAQQGVFTAIALNFALGFIFPALRVYCFSPVFIALTFAFIYGLRQGATFMLDWVSRTWETCVEAMLRAGALLTTQCQALVESASTFMQASKEESYELSDFSQKKEEEVIPPLSTLLNSRSGLFKTIRENTGHCAPSFSLSRLAV